MHPKQEKQADLPVFLYRDSLAIQRYRDICADMIPTSQPIDPALYSSLGEKPALAGSKCQSCGTVSFPTRESCPKCCGTDVKTVALETRGTLWTWTTQNFPPKSPPYAVPADRFQPYAVGYVELTGQVMVETRLIVDDHSLLEIGMEMELVLDEFAKDRSGRALTTFAFRPAPDNSSAEQSQ